MMRIAAGIKIREIPATFIIEGMLVQNWTSVKRNVDVPSGGVA